MSKAADILAEERAHFFSFTKAIPLSPSTEELVRSLQRAVWQHGVGDRPVRRYFDAYQTPFNDLKVKKESEDLWWWIRLWVFLGMDMWGERDRAKSHWACFDHKSVSFNEHAFTNVYSKFVFFFPHNSESVDAQSYLLLFISKRVLVKWSVVLFLK